MARKRATSEAPRKVIRKALEDAAREERSGGKPLTYERIARDTVWGEKLYSTVSPSRTKRRRTSGYRWPEELSVRQFPEEPR